MADQPIWRGQGNLTAPLTDAELRASAVPMTGSVTVSGTTAVSGTVSISGTVPVSGTFWQATQPVSIASMPTTPVTGTFWQATQPVSIAATVTVANAGTFAVQAAQSGTWNIGSITTLPALVAGSAIIGKVGIDQTTPGTTNAISLAQIGVTTIATGNGVVGGGVQRVAIASDNSAVPTSAPTLTKGTQGANGWSVQQLKDAGRTTLAMTAEFSFAQTAETLLTMTLSSNGAATTTFSSRVISSGKRLRITSVALHVEGLGSGTAPQRAYLRLRVNTGGATTASSPLQAVWSCANNPAVVKTGTAMNFDIPDGLEFAGDGTATFGFTLETPDWVTSTATGRAKITVLGFEY